MNKNLKGFGLLVALSLIFSAAFFINTSVVFANTYVSLALDPSTPSTTTIYAGQTSVEFSRIKISVIDAVTIYTVTLASDSTNITSTISNFKIYDGTTLIGSSDTLSTITFTNGLSVPAYSNKTLKLVADIKSTVSAGTIRLGISNVSFGPGGPYGAVGIPVYGYNMTVSSNPALSIITSPTLLNATVNSQYFNTIEGSGVPVGQGYGFSIISGSFPSGITFTSCSLNVCAGIGGTPTVTGIYTFTLALTNSSQSVSKQFTLTVDSDPNALSITSIDGPTDVKVGDSNSWVVKILGPSTGSYTYTVNWADGSSESSGTGLNPTFLHTYTKAAIYNTIFTVKDGNGQSNYKAVPIWVTDSTSPSIKLTSPNGGEVLVANEVNSTSYSVLANITGIEKIANPKLDFILLKSDVVLGSLVPQPMSVTSASYTWSLGWGQTYYYDSTKTKLIKVTDGKSASDYKIRVVLYNGSTLVAQDDSDANFTITGSTSTVPSIKIISPSDGQIISQGKQTPIAWDSNLVSNVTAFLVSSDSTGNGVGRVGVIGSVYTKESNTLWWDGKTVWDDLINGKVKTIAPGFYKIYLTGSVEGVTNQSVNDTSDSSFKITAESITITSPTADTSWTRGEAHTVSWTSSGVSGNGKIRLSSCCASSSNLESGLLDISPIALSAGTYSFSIPTNYPLGVAKLYVMNSSETVYDGIYYVNITDPNTEPSILITSPKGNEQWAQGTTQTIKWSTTGKISRVTISLAEMITESSNTIRDLGTVYNTGSYEWTIPKCNTKNPCSSNTEVTPGKYRIMINDVDSMVGDVTDESFNIVGDKSSSNQKPMGWIDSISKDGYISGWAVDPDHLEAPITIHVYFDGKAGEGKNAGSDLIVALTDIQRDDVNLIMSSVGAHGFKIAIPESLKDGKKHTAYVYAIDIDDLSGSSNVQLWGSPKSFSFAKTNTITRHSRGTIVIGEGGTVYFLGAEIRYPFPSPEVFFSWGHKFSSLVLANSGDLAMPIGPVAQLKQ